MSFATYLAVSETRPAKNVFEFVHNDRARAEYWFQHELHVASKKNVVAEFTGEVIQSYDLTTMKPLEGEIADDIPLQETCSEAEAAELQAQSLLTCERCGFVAKTGGGLASHERACRRVDEDLARLKVQDIEEDVGEDEDVSPPCPQPEVALAGELREAIQAYNKPVMGKCPFCEEDGALYDFIDPETKESNRACVACWIEVSK